MTDDNSFDIKVWQDDKDPTLMHISANLPPTLFSHDEYLREKRENFVSRYMPNDCEYGHPTEMDISSYGWMTTYISSTFLNGWINYVKPVNAFTM